MNLKSIVKKKKFIRKNIKKITVFLGGSAYEKKNYETLKLISNYNFIPTLISVNEHKKKFIQKVKKNIPKLKIIKNTINIPKVIFNSDLVFSGGGYTKLECAYLKTPVIPISLHRHQDELIEIFNKEFNLSRKFFNQINKKNIKLLFSEFNYETRFTISKKFKSYFKKNGIQNICKIILNEI